MLYSVQETADAVGVSVRTLHYYDEIGLLKPAALTEAGYRLYGGEELKKLSLILFYRELGFSLKEVGKILKDPAFDKARALQEQKRLLLLQSQRYLALAEQIDRIIMEEPMDKKQTLSAREIESQKAAYATEAKARWGATEEYKESERRHAQYDENRESAVQRDAEGIFAAFAESMDKEPNDPAVQALVRRWQEHISKNHYPCSKEILSSLGIMYTGDPRFKEYLDSFGDGCAAFMGEAIALYCARA